MNLGSVLKNKSLQDILIFQKRNFNKDFINSLNISSIIHPTSIHCEERAYGQHKLLFAVS